MEVIAPTRLGKYHLTRLLAHGGMSEVYLAQDEKDQQLYAIKLVKQEFTEHYQYFCHEVQVLHLLEHMHILPILDYQLDEQEEDGLAYYVTPYIEHGSLKERIAAKPLSLAETGVILNQLGDALQFIHESGLVHRDIKPANVLLDETNHVWLADFGLAKEMNTPHDLTDAEHLIGTPLYLAPELLEGPASTRSDIYALGIMLYEMLTGTTPFKGESPLAICCKHLYESPIPPSLLNQLISSAVEQVILRAIAKRPEERFSTVCELAEAYQQALLVPAILPQEITFLGNALETAYEQPKKASVVAKPRPSRRRVLSQQQRRLPLAVAIAMLVMLFLLGGLSLAIEYQSSPVSPVSSGAQMISLPDPTPNASHTNKVSNGVDQVNKPSEQHK